nr:ATP-binding protein [Pleionea sp. CnH1-48]
MVQSHTGQIWIGTYKGLYVLDPDTGAARKVELGKAASYILSLLVDRDNNIWVGTFNWGLFRVSPSEPVLNFLPDKSNASSLSDKTVLSLYQDRSGIIWVGTYNAGVNYFDPLHLTFGSYNNSLSSLPCLLSDDIRSVYPVSSEQALFGTLKGLSLVNLNEKSCKHYTHDASSNKSLSNNEVFKIFPAGENHYWIGTDKGLDIISLKNGDVKRFGHLIDNALVFDILPYDKALLLATNKGLFHFDMDKRSAQKITNEEGESFSISVLRRLDSGAVLVGTSRGLHRLDTETGTLFHLWKDNPDLNHNAVHSVAVTQNHGVWFTEESQGVFQWDPVSNEVKNRTNDFQLTYREGFAGFHTYDDNTLWLLSVNNGLLKFDLKADDVEHYLSEHGLINNIYNLGASASFPDGRVLFGSRNGFNLLAPEKLQVNLSPPTISLQSFTRLGEIVEPRVDYEGFSIDNHINDMESVNLSHREAVIGFHFLATHYLSPNKLEYEYQLSGLEPNWIKSSFQNRRVTYSNLEPGDYVFKVRAKTINGIWSEEALTLPISVAPAPWKTWWAYTLYFLFLVVSGISFLWYRTKTLRLRAEFLEDVVEQRTTELKVEKEKVEQLLEKKNEEFANISHEFRTPLTLILGPLGQMLSSEENSIQSKRKLSVIQRSGFRLLRMVDQLLNLQTFRVKSIVEKRVQPASKIILLIAESFEQLASEKNISMKYTVEADIELLLTQDSIEKILLNLLSNALKYTPSGNSISLIVKKSENNLVMSVEDTGIGIPEAKLPHIFDKYFRVLGEESDSVVGAGIGLALVKELVDSHDGTIDIHSEVDKGTSISVSLPIVIEACEKTAIESINQELIDIELNSLQDRESEILEVESESQDASSRSSNPKLLVIEDNEDMSSYILSCLKNQYDVMAAPNGQKGVELAIEQVPDLIISDIMMPGLNGYEVLKTIRGNSVTNHIPVILLTARGDQKSRLKGWEHQADEYLTKPFNEQELILRIDNLLSIREIVQKSFQEQSFKPAESTESSTALSVGDQKKQEFIEELNSVIDGLYFQEGLRISEIAKGVAMSERQLFRKLKALLDMTPTHYLRDYRLVKAADLLRLGQPASNVALDVGFASYSYFGKCFKAKYRVAPSDFQAES